MSGEVSRVWTVGGYRPLSPKPIADVASAEGWPMQWHGLVNSVSCPRGRRYGEAHFLLSQDSLDALDKTGPLSIECEHEDGTTTWAGYYVIRTEAVSRDTLKPPHWVTLADRRYIFERVAANKRYNLRSGTGSSWITDTLNAGTAYTWQEILDDLWALLPAGIAAGAPSIAAAAASTPENLIFEGMSAWEAINRLVTAVGCAICYNPLDETFSCPELQETQTDLEQLKTDSENRLLWEFRPESLPEVNYPEKVTVTFKALPGESSDSDPFEAPPTTVETSLGAGGTTGTTWPIVDTLFAWDDNSAARTARAAEVASALKGLLKPLATPWGAVYAGVVEFATGEEITDILWTSDGYRGMRTIARSVYHRFQWPEVPEFGGGGSAASSIEYKIVSTRVATDTGAESIYEGLTIATVTVILATPDKTDLIGTQVEVVDHSECVFDLSSAELVDVWGWASWRVAESLDPDDSPGTLTPAHWSADDRCC